MRVFVSSIIRDYEKYRETAKNAIEALDYEACGYGVHTTSLTDFTAGGMSWRS